MGKQFTHYARGTLLLLIEFQLLIELLIQDLFTSILLSFQHFPHGTYTLSLNILYLALEDGSPLFKQVFSHFTLYQSLNKKNILIDASRFYINTGLSPSLVYVFHVVRTL